MGKGVENARVSGIKRIVREDLSGKVTLSQSLRAPME